MQANKGCISTSSWKTPVLFVFLFWFGLFTLSHLISLIFLPKTECGCLHGRVIENGCTCNPLTLSTVPVLVRVWVHLLGDPISVQLRNAAISPLSCLPEFMKTDSSIDSCVKLQVGVDICCLYSIWQVSSAVDWIVLFVSLYSLCLQSWTHFCIIYYATASQTRKGKIIKIKVTLKAKLAKCNRKSCYIQMRNKQSFKKICS